MDAGTFYTERFYVLSDSTHVAVFFSDHMNGIALSETPQLTERYQSKFTAVEQEK